MKIGILASPSKRIAWESKKKHATSYSWVQDNEAHEEYDVFIDLDLDNHIHRLNTYTQNTHTLFILSAVKYSIEGALNALNLKNVTHFRALGINALPTLLERNVMECSNPFNLNLAIIETIALALGYENITVVNSRVGMVSPRIVCMIINEAYYTVQEQTAQKSDIDQAMKLGTNYPKGPFEWCEQTGIREVYEVLESLYQDTHDGRYKICPLLKQEYLKSHPY